MWLIDAAIEWITDPNKLTAVATVVIAFFTGTLFFATFGQLKHLRREFLSTHRPKIVIHSVEITHDKAAGSAGETIGASVVYFNIGDTPARIKEINAQITRRPLPLQSGLGLGIGTRLSSLPVPKKPIISGTPNYFGIFSKHTLENERHIERAAQDGGRGGALICLGQIVYEDGRGVRRETGFCRRLDTKTARWVSMDHPEYEYAY